MAFFAFSWTNLPIPQGSFSILNVTDPSSPHIPDIRVESWRLTCVCSRGLSVLISTYSKTTNDFIPRTHKAFTSTSSWHFKHLNYLALRLSTCEHSQWGNNSNECTNNSVCAASVIREKHLSTSYGVFYLIEYDKRHAESTVNVSCVICIRIGEMFPT